MPSWEPPPFSLESFHELPARTPSPPAMSSTEFAMLLSSPKLELESIPDFEECSYVVGENGGHTLVESNHALESEEQASAQHSFSNGLNTSSATSTRVGDNYGSGVEEAEDRHGVRAVDTSSRHSPRIISKPKSRRVSKAEEECLIAVGLLADLKGTTAARSRKMTEDERNLMLHKRRLRNRASAARSREKQRNTVAVLAQQVEELSQDAFRLRKDCSDAQSEIQRLREQNATLLAAFASRAGFHFNL